MDLLKKWWPTLVIAATALWGAFGSQIQAIVASHPKWTVVISAIVAIGSHLLASPLPPSPAMVARVRKMINSGLVCILMVCLVGCQTPQWVKDAEADLPTVLEIVTEILPIISAASGSPVPTQVETDIQLAQDLYAKFEKTKDQSLIPQIQNAVAAAQSDINGILAALHISDPNTMKTVIAALGVASAVLAAIASNIPVTASSSALAAKTSTKPLRVPKPEEVRASFNAIIAGGGHPELRLAN
jgi:hypothetical protein